MVFNPSVLNKKHSRRLQKKLRIGEFQEFGFTLTFIINLQQKGFEEALDDWIHYLNHKAGALVAAVHYWATGLRVTSANIIIEP